MSMMSRKLPRSLTDTLRPSGDVELVRQLSSELSEAMRLLHGGEWRILICHEEDGPLVVVRQK